MRKIKDEERKKERKRERNRERERKEPNPTVFCGSELRNLMSGLRKGDVDAEP